MPRILLIDDDDEFRTMLRRSLVNLAHEVIEAASGSKALALHRASPADVLLTDLIMPDKEGLEIIQDFHRNFPAVKIIAMSGGGRINAGDFLHIAKLFGAHRIFTKPFPLQELSDAIEELMAPVS